jgi:hypothetical protein
VREIKNFWDAVEGIYVPVGDIVHYVRVNGEKATCVMTMAEYEAALPPKFNRAAREGKPKCVKSDVYDER